MCAKAEMRGLMEAVAKMEGKLNGLLTKMENLEEKVVPEIAARLSKVERGDGEGSDSDSDCACGEGGCVCGHFTIETVKKEAEEEPGEQATGEPKEKGVERSGQSEETKEEDSEDGKSQSGEEPDELPTVGEVWKLVKAEKAGRGSQDNRYKKERHVELLMSIDPRAGPVLRILGAEEAVRYCVRFQSSVLADLNIRIRGAVSSRDRRAIRTSTKFCRDRLFTKAEKMMEGGSLLILDWDGGVSHMQELAKERMSQCPRRKDNIKAVRAVWDLVAERQRKELSGTTAEGALTFARRQVSYAMVEGWADLLSLGDNLLRVACGALRVQLDNLELVEAEVAWGTGVRDAVSGIAVGACVLGKSERLENVSKGNNMFIFRRGSREGAATRAQGPVRRVWCGGGGRRSSEHGPGPGGDSLVDPRNLGQVVGLSCHPPEQEPL